MLNPLFELLVRFAARRVAGFCGMHIELQISLSRLHRSGESTIARKKAYTFSNHIGFSPFVLSFCCLSLLRYFKVTSSGC